MSFRRRKKSFAAFWLFWNGYFAPMEWATASPESMDKSWPLPGVKKDPQKYAHSPCMPWNQGHATLLSARLVIVRHGWASRPAYLFRGAARRENDYEKKR